MQEEYKDAVTSGRWHRQVELQDGGRVMLNSPLSMHHYHPEPFPTVRMINIACIYIREVCLRHFFRSFSEL